MKSAVIVAGGLSQRFKENKMFVGLMGKPLITYAVNTFLPLVDELILVTNKNDILDMQKLFGGNVKIVPGGATRTLSVLNGLNSLSKESLVVAIHDGARPYVDDDLIRSAFKEASISGSAVPVIKMQESSYLKDAEKIIPLEREKICTVQTPQVFLTEQIIHAYKMRDDIKVYTDDSQVYLDTFEKITFIEGSPNNKKITYPSDIPTIKIGNGYDIHRLELNRKLFLGGIEIPHSKGLFGHSDADVVLHAIIDSLLSAANERDIGVQFPNTDLRFKDISSLILLKNVSEILKRKNLYIQNISCLIICEAPLLSNYLPLMVEKISQTLDVPQSSISISVGTSEGVGLIGNEEAIAAQAVSLVINA